MNRYILEPYKSPKNKHKCPNCNKKDFTKYIDTETNDYINENVGWCNNRIKCAYHFSPKEYFKDNFIPRKKLSSSTSFTPTKETSYISNSLMNKSINYSNNFITFLEENLFGEEITKELVELYKIGSSKHWKGATIFWQIDNQNRVRSGKVLLYNKNNGKRIKEPYSHISWIHKILNLKDYTLQQCLFGLHLVKENPNKTIAIVESEKTAIIASVYIPEYIWLACGSLNNLSKKMLTTIKGKNVVLFPDLKCYDLWKKKTSQIQNLCNFHISSLLEKNASAYEKNQGYDLADYLINLQINYKDYL